MTDAPPLPDTPSMPPRPPYSLSNWSDISSFVLWVMCFFFVVLTCVLFLSLQHKVDAIAEAQAQQFYLIKAVEQLQTDIGVLRAKSEERAMIIEALKPQVLTNVLDMNRLEKTMDLFRLRLNDLTYAPNATTDKKRTPAPESGQ